MNIAEILKDCPEDTKLYSPIFGEMELLYIDDKIANPIVCLSPNGSFKNFTSDGRYFPEYPDSECMLFPSKTQRDWSKFGVAEKKTKHKFKPFDKVLVRDRDDKKWDCDIFCHLDDKERVFICIRNWWRQCIPYKGNEHLLRTTNKPE